LMLFNLV